MTYNNGNIRKEPAPGRSAEHEEYGRAAEGITICPSCGNVHFQKRWWHSLDEIKKKLEDKTLHPTPNREETCPACKMAKEHLYEGELIISGFPERFIDDLTHLIDNFGATATEKDPQDRIITVERTGGELRVLTTENQMVDKLARKIQDAYKNASVELSISKEPYEVNRARITYPQE